MSGVDYTLNGQQTFCLTVYDYPNSKCSILNAFMTNLNMHILKTFEIIVE